MHVSRYMLERKRRKMSVCVCVKERKRERECIFRKRKRVELDWLMKENTAGHYKERTKKQERL